MAEKVLILGPSGTGKSHSISTLNPDETFVICPDRKTMPFRGSRKKYKTQLNEEGKLLMGKSNYYETNSMAKVHKCIKYINDKMIHIKVVVIDTITYAMIESVMSTIEISGWEKFSIYAQEFYNLVNDIPKMREDLIIVITAHVTTESVNDVMETSMKVPKGKLIKDMITPEGLFTIVLYSDVIVEDSENEKVKGVFYTQKRNGNTCKAPEGMFPSFAIPNDLNYVIKCINAYNNDENPPVAKTEKVSSDNDNF